MHEGQPLLEPEVKVVILLALGLALLLDGGLAEMCGVDLSWVVVARKAMPCWICSSRATMTCVACDATCSYSLPVPYTLSQRAEMAGPIASTHRDSSPIASPPTIQKIARSSNSRMTTGRALVIARFGLLP